MQLTETNIKVLFHNSSLKMIKKSLGRKCTFLAMSTSAKQEHSLIVKWKHIDSDTIVGLHKGWQSLSPSDYDKIQVELENIRDGRGEGAVR